VVVLFSIVFALSNSHPLIGGLRNNRWRPFNLIGGPFDEPGRPLPISSGLTFKDLANNEPTENELAPENPEEKQEVDSFVNSLKSSMRNKMFSMLLEEAEKEAEDEPVLRSNYRARQMPGFSHKRRFLPAPLLK